LPFSGQIVDPISRRMFFALASKTPIAAILIGVALFGGTIGMLFAAGAAIAAYLVIDHRSIYPDQQLAFT